MAKGVQIKDLGIGKLRSQLKKLGGQKITIGVQGESAARKHPNADASVGQVAAWLEFGTPGSDDKNPDAQRTKQPARPFVRTTFDRHRKDTDRAVRKAASDLIDGRAEIEEVQDRVAGEALGHLRKTFDDARSWAAALADSTVERKGHDQPLLDHGVVRDSTSWAVRDKGGAILRQGGDE